MSDRLPRACLAVTLLFVAAACAHAAPCDTVGRVRLPNTTIVAVTLVDSGKFVPPPAVRQPAAEFFTAFNTLPAFCRVQLVMRPSTDSDIGIEVWLPLARWNGRYLGVGNGSYGGSINYYRLGEALRSGFATSSTDTGHRGAPTDTAWATGHPEKQADFDYRATHLTAQTAKALVRAMYGSDATHSYFSSCSNGGRQGLMEAERYPTDYDGIMSGAPAPSWGFRTFVSGDLRAYQQRNGKMIIWHGGADAPDASVAYYSRVRVRLGDSTVRTFLQLYLVPGMHHCGGGLEPNEIGQWLRPADDPQHSLFKALEDWVENGVEPARVIARKFAVDGNPASGVVQTRMLYPYPRVAGETQFVGKWEVRGDTSGAPAGCSARAGLNAIDAWLAAMTRHDSVGLARVMSPRFVFSAGNFTTTDTFFVARSIGQLADYARRRATHHERLLLQAITFNRWRGPGLEFGPVYFLRSADDLGSAARPGIGKGEYLCNGGIHVLNLGPRPDGDDARSAMRPSR